MASVYYICKFSPDGETVVCPFKGIPLEVIAIVRTLRKGNPGSTIKVFTQDEVDYYTAFNTGLAIIGAYDKACLKNLLPTLDSEIKKDAYYWARAAKAI